MKMRRLISAIIALLLVVNLSVTAFAAEWYLEDGDITVSAGDSGQTVSQGSSTDVADNAPVIKQRDSSKTTDSTITISTSDNATANVTIEDVNIDVSGAGEAAVSTTGERPARTSTLDGRQQDALRRAVTLMPAWHSTPTAM